MPFVENLRVPLSKPGYWVELREFGYLDDQELNLRLAQNLNVSGQGQLSEVQVNQIPLVAVYRETLVNGIVAWNIDDENGTLPINDQTVMMLGRDQGRVLWHILKHTSYRKMLRDVELEVEPATTPEVVLSDEDFPEPPNGGLPETTVISAIVSPPNAY